MYGNGIETKVQFRRYNGADLGNGARVTYHVATRLRAGRPGVRIRVGSKDIILLKTSRPSPGPTQVPVQWATRTVYPGVKRSERKAAHSPFCSVEVRMSTAVPPLPCMHSWCVRRQFFFYLYWFLETSALESSELMLEFWPLSNAPSNSLIPS